MIGKKIFVWSMAVLILLAGIAFAHEGHKHVYRGTVTAVTAESLTLTTSAGQTVTVLLEPGTKYTRPGDASAAVTAKDVHKDMRVVVSHEERDGKHYATEVKLGKMVAKRLSGKSKSK